MPHENHNIRCSVVECMHNAKSTHLCSLEQITVGKSESNVNSSECTECSSFRK
ncbi:DUF1540 domain-containing protein [Mycoplasmatota bacterium WC44]